MLDVIVRGGDLVDGTGSPRRRADIGIKDGLIVEVAAGSKEAAAKEIDAAGLVVAPGFIDVHTHYDAQAFWDPQLSPSVLHGVTSVLGGNCGFTIAPLGDDRSVEYVLGMLSRVEGIPKATLDAGIDVRWQSFAEYLGALEGTLALNAGFFVGHSTVRRVAMGERFREAATDDDLRRMAQLVDESVRSGALGFSSSRGSTHNDQDGLPVPSRLAARDELLALSATLRPHEGSMLAVTPTSARWFGDEDYDLLTGMALAAGKPLNWNLLTIRPETTDEDVASKLAASDRAAAEGAEVFGLTFPDLMTFNINLESGYLFDMLEPWAEVLRLPLDQRLDAFGRPDVRARLAAAAEAQRVIWSDLGMLEVADSERHPELVDRSLASIAAEGRRPVVDAMLDLAAADSLRTVFRIPGSGDDPQTWAARRAVWTDPRVAVGGSDAGAHLDMIQTSGFFTRFLGHHVRELGLLPLETAVHLVTGALAARFELRNRGVVDVGFAADLVVLDEAAVDSADVVVRRDLPADGMRLFAEARGIEHVLVNGVEVLRSGQPTGERPGAILRPGGR